MSDIFAVLAVLLFAAPWFLGIWAFVRTGKLRRELDRALARIIELERAIGLAPLPSLQDAPAVAPAPEPLAAAPQAPPKVKAPKPPGPPLLARIERAIASNWFVWIGGALIVLAVVSILRYAIDRNWFGPPAQLAAAYLLGAGLFAAAEWVRKHPPTLGLSDTQLKHLPSILAAAALFALFASTYAGFANFRIIPLALAFVLLALTAIAAIMLSLRYGPWLAALGLSGGYLAPGLVRFFNPSAIALFGYIFALTAAALAVIKLRQWKGFVWLAGGGALVWALYWLDTPFGSHDLEPAAFFVVALAALGIAFAWSDANAPVEISRAGIKWKEPMLAAHVIAAAAAFILFNLVDRAHTPPAIAAILAFCAMAAVVASVREGFALMPLGAAALGILVISEWPGLPVRGAREMPADINLLFRAAGALGFIFSGGGWLMMARNRRTGFGAALAALGPIGVVVAAHESVGFMRAPFLWIVPALFLAGLNTFALERFVRKLGGVDRAPGAAAAFSLGAAASIIFAVYFALERSGIWLTLAFAALIPAMAWLDLRFRLPALRIAISLTLVVVMFGLTLGFDPLQIGPTLIFNAMTPGFGLSALALWGAAWLYRRTSVATRVANALEASAIVAAAVGISWTVRHLATGGFLIAPYISLAETGGYATTWLGAALAFAARFGPKPRFVLFWSEAAFAFFGAAIALWCGVFALNPWWGPYPSLVPGWPILNILLVAYGIPAALAAAYAILKRRQGMERRARAAGIVAMVLAFLNVTLEVRRWFHPADLAQPPIQPLEAWAYTAAWVVFAGALLAIGLIRQRPSLRYASLGVLIIAIVKAFGFDMGALTGILRALSYFGLGAAIIGVALIYQRYVFPRAFAKNEPDSISPG